MGTKYDIIKFEDGDFTLDVNISPTEETVWLTQQEIALLFDKSRSTITEHIVNIFKNLELDQNSVCRKNRQTANDGKSYEVLLYNLDVILAVGYRVNSKRGVQFRKWANSVLKQYLLNGYSINNDRILAYQSNILQLEASYYNIESRIKNLERTVYADNNKLIFEGEILEPHSFLTKLFFLAKERIIIIDNYADAYILALLTNITIPVTIYTSTSSYINKCEIKENITIIKTDVFHDRYIIIDNIIYIMGTSFNSIGKKRFIISRINDISAEMILSNIK